MKTPPLAQIMIANRPGLAEHLLEQAATMRAPRDAAAQMARRSRKARK